MGELTNGKQRFCRMAWMNSTEAYCSSLTSDEVISENHRQIASRVTPQKIIFHSNECIVLFLTCYFMSWTHNSAKNNHRSLISQLSPRTVVSYLALWRHHSVSVTSCEREILALWRHIRWWSCTRKLAKRPSSLVNNNRVYRFLIAMYSRPSM